MFVINIKGVIILSKIIDGFKSGFVFNDVVFVDYSLYEKNGNKMYFLTFMEKDTFKQCKILYFPRSNFNESVLNMIKSANVDVLFDVSNKGFTVNEIIRREDSLSVLAV